MPVDTLSPFEYSARTFETANGSTPFFLSRDKNIKVSYDYYLGRIDKLFVNRYGEFFLKQGVPALNPRNPEDVPTALEIATIEMPPYVYNINDITIALTDHKRFRMQDIARMEDRLKNVEYYTSLSLLESETKNLTLRDSATGLDKFKTGFFVDNFRVLLLDLLVILCISVLLIWKRVISDLNTILHRLTCFWDLKLSLELQMGC